MHVYGVRPPRDTGPSTTEPDPVDSFAEGLLEGFWTGLKVGIVIGGLIALGGTPAIVGAGLALAGAFAGGLTVGEIFTAEDLSVSHYTKCPVIIVRYLRSASALHIIMESCIRFCFCS